MDAAFKALADPTRRRLLDMLFRRDGQTLGQLERRLSMTRFGVMKHLRVLEEARLIVTKRRGREKFHFLNVVPIRQIHDRWIDKYAAPVAAMLTGLKKEIEEETMEKVYEIYIKTTPERLWQAITDPAIRAKYSFGVGVYSDWTPGSQYHARATDITVSPGAEIADGDNLEVNPPRLLVQRFRALWSDDVKREGYSRVTWQIEPVGDSCRLTVTHDLLPAGANAELYGGWPMVLSGLKTWLETGETLTTPGSQMYIKARVGA
jgi:DNA-binding transcriptional ArsR family regulator